MDIKTTMIYVHANREAGRRAGLIDEEPGIIRIHTWTWGIRWGGSSGGGTSTSSGAARAQQTKCYGETCGGGGGGGQPNPQPENTRYCEVFADALARLVEKNIHKIAASVDIGLYLADWTYYYSYIEKQTDIAHWGFKPDLSVSGQGSDLLRHITLSSSSILLDGIGLASGFDDIRNKYQAANAADPDRRGEALASLAGNAVGRGVGYAMKNRIGQLMTPGQLRARFSVTPMQQLVHHVAYGTEGL